MKVEEADRLRSDVDSQFSLLNEARLAMEQHSKAELTELQRLLEIQEGSTKAQLEQIKEEVQVETTYSRQSMEALNE